LVHLKRARLVTISLVGSCPSVRSAASSRPRTSADEAERNMRSQQEALRTMADPFARRDGDIRAHEADGAAQAGQGADKHPGQQAGRAARSGGQDRKPGTTH
jgi:hypothetical protein